MALDAKMIVWYPIGKLFGSNGAQLRYTQLCHKHLFIMSEHSTRWNRFATMAERCTCGRIYYSPDGFACFTWHVENASPSIFLFIPICSIEYMTCMLLQMQWWQSFVFATAASGGTAVSAVGSMASASHHLLFERPEVAIRNWCLCAVRNLASVCAIFAASPFFSHVFMVHHQQSHIGNHRIIENKLLGVSMMSVDYCGVGHPFEILLKTLDGTRYLMTRLNDIYDFISSLITALLDSVTVSIRGLGEVASLGRLFEATYMLVSLVDAFKGLLLGPDE